MKIYFNWDKFAKSLELPEINERIIVLFFLGICMSWNEHSLCIELFRSRSFLYFGERRVIFVL